MSVYGDEFENYITDEVIELLIQELQRYLVDLIPFLNLKPHTPVIKKFYLCTCLRKFTFFYDKLKQGKMKVEQIVFSHVLSELLELRDPQLPYHIATTNWFSSHSTLRVYSNLIIHKGEFIKLDKNKNGSLSRLEMSKFKDGRLSDVFLDQLFDSVQLFNGELDFLVYLDLILALEKLNTTEGLAWIFRILDIKNDGYLDDSTVAFFLKDIFSRSIENNVEPIPVNDMLVRKY